MKLSHAEIRELKTLISFIPRRRKKHSLLIVLLTLLSTITEIFSIGAIIPFISVLAAPNELLNNEVAIDLFQFFHLNPYENLEIKVSLIFLVSIIIATFIRLALLWLTIFLSAKISNDLSISIFEKNIRQPLSHHVELDSSKFISAIASKTYVISNAIIFSMISIFTSIFILSVIVLLIILFVSKNALYALIGFLLVYYFISFITQKNVYLNSKNSAYFLDKTIKVTQETLGGIRDIILGDYYSKFIDKFRVYDMNTRLSYAKIEFISSSPRFIIESLGMILIAVIAYFQLKNSSNPSMEIAILGGIAMGAQRSLPLIQNLYSATTKIKGCIDILKQVNSFLLLKTSTNAGQKNQEEISFNKTINIQNLSFSYKDGTKVFENINLEIMKGEKVVILGETGSGKSTLVDILMGFYTNFSGEMLIDGKKLTKDNILNWQKKISHVPQAIYLSNSTIKENIIFGKNEDNFDMSFLKECSSIAYLDDFVKKSKESYETVVGERGLKISGGQRQRIGIARALYTRPSLLILDEATNALDSDTEEIIMNNLINKIKDLTIIMITHNSKNLNWFDKIIRVKNNNISIENI